MFLLQLRNFNGKRAGKSTDTVINELKVLKNNYGINHITWLDDDFFDKEQTYGVDKMEKNNLNMTWDASNGLIASAAVVEPELIAAAKIRMYWSLFWA